MGPPDSLFPAQIGAQKAADSASGSYVNALLTNECLSVGFTRSMAQKARQFVELCALMEIG